MRVRPARPPCCPGRRPWPSASSVRTPSIPRSAACRTPSCARCRPARARTLCTASRSASPPTLPGPAAAWLLDIRGPARGVPRHRTCGRRAHRGRDRGHRAGGGHRPGRLVGAAPGPAAGRLGARRLPGRRGHAVPRLAGRPGRRPGRLRPGAVRVRARRGHRRLLPRRPPRAAARRGHQPRRAGQSPGRTRLARPVRADRAARPAARCGASSATCPCWCTGRDPRSACCQTGAPISVGPCIRAGSWWSGELPASPAPGTDPPS